MHTTNTLILGAGQAGLALSHWLTVLGRDHLILERGQVAERWHGERWDSLRLLTPNWMARLPGWSYDGPNPDGFMTAAEVASYFDRYATSFAAPVHEHTTVHRLAADGEGFVVGTDGWRVPVEQCGDRHRLVRSSGDPSCVTARLAANPPSDPERVPQPRRRPTWRCSGRRCLCHWCATR